VRIETAAQVRLMIDQRQWKYIRPFIESPMSVGEAAKVLGITLEMLYPRVQRFLSNGLLQVVESRERKGRDIKIYAATGRTFFIPVGALEVSAFELPDLYFGQILADSALDFLHENVERFADPGLEVAPLDDLQIRIVPSPGQRVDPLEVRAALWEWKLLRLTSERARQLQYEMYDVIRRAQADQVDVGDVWILNARYLPVGRSVDQDDFSL
jgi:hypothetical protein